MNIIGLFQAHGIVAVFVGALVEQLGAPVPAVPMLLLAGARSANDGLFALKALSAATAACAIADTLWFLAGRSHGHAVLRLLCRVSMSPGTCVQRSERSFQRRRVLTLLFAKFIPGVSTLTAPLAGALRMPLRTFVLLDVAGTLLWAGTALAAGLVFHDQVDGIVNGISELGSHAAPLFAVLLAMCVSWRLLHRRVIRRGRSTTNERRSSEACRDISSIQVRERPLFAARTTCPELKERP